MNITRIAILTSSRFGIAGDCLSELCASPNLSIVGVVVAGRAPARRWRTVLRKIRKIMRIGIAGALNGVRMRAWYESADAADVAAICRERGVPLFEVPHVNSSETVELFQGLQPDLGLSLGNGYISRKVFDLPKSGMINVHGERLPDYQNAQSVIWPIYHNETRTGLSIHQIDAGIDTGAVLHSEEFDILFSPRLEDTVRRTVAVTHVRTPRAVRYVCENYATLAARAAPQPAGRVFTTPSISQFARMVRNNRMLYQASSARGGGRND
ncbi:hypothetical protein AYO42_00635 [Rhizomicrobium sp. SCGC AG-212-E05]|nr:hypothetical protein AYO42_00635 [Rhizomicrobium sp. SCGC AG-212-E05]